MFCIVLCTEHNSCNINYFRCCGLPTIPRLSTKYPTNIPQNVHIQPRNTPHFIPLDVGGDSLCPYFHIIKYAYSFPRTRMSTLSNTYIHSTTHVCSFLILRFFHICGHDKSVPYGCLLSAKMLLIGCYFVVVYVSANTIKLCTNVHLQLPMAQQHTQNAYFCNAKTILLQCKNPLFARQKPYFCTAKRGFLYNGIMCKRM